jgi:predicted ribonuclease YlaK
MLPRVVLERIVYRPRYEALLRMASAMPTEGVANSVLNLEFDLRESELHRVLSDIEAVAQTYDERSTLIACDTSYFVHGPELSSQSLHQELEVEDSDALVVAVPMVVVDELDILKDRGNSNRRSGGDSVRTRARGVLRFLDRATQDSRQQGGGLSGPLFRNSSSESDPQGSGQIGDVHVRIVLDEPDAVRRANPDDEIVETVASEASLAGRPITLLTADYGMSMRARARGVPVALYEQTN